VKILKELTWTYVIESPSLALQRQGQREVIARLFEVYADAADSESERSLFPPYYREEIEKTNSTAKRTRLVCDLIAGMTEPEAVGQYRQIMSGGPPLSLQPTGRMKSKKRPFPEIVADMRHIVCSVIRQRPMPGGQGALALGMGFFVARDVFITCHHVLNNTADPHRSGDSYQLVANLTGTNGKVYPIPKSSDRD
jgi:hypothetical protein